MGDTYHFGVSKIIIHSLHILIGIWLVYLGYKKITDKKLDDINYYLLTGLGIILFFYFLIISYKEFGNIWNYAFGVPNYLIFITHLINALLFIFIGIKFLDIGKIISLYLIISGSLGGMYHGHLLLLK